MKKHSFLFYFFLWPFWLVFTFYKYFFIAIFHLMGYIEHGIDTFISNHPIHFRPMLQRIKGLILYCYNRSAMISRTMYISLLALNIIFTGFLLNHCTTIFHYILVFLSFIFIFIVSGILGSFIFLLIDRLLSRFKRNTEDDNIESSSCEADSTSEKESTDNTLSTTNSDELTHNTPELHNEIYDTSTTDTCKPVQDTDFTNEPLPYSGIQENVSEEKFLDSVECTTDAYELIHDTDFISEPLPYSSNQENISEEKLLEPVECTTDAYELIHDTDFTNEPLPYSSNQENISEEKLLEPVECTTETCEPVRDTDFIGQCLRYVRNRDNSSEEKLFNSDDYATDTYKFVRDTDFISECLRYVRNRDSASKEKTLVINNPETIATIENVGKYAITEGTITATMIQHQFNASFFTACSIIDTLEEYNVISSGNSFSPVKVLMTLDDFNTLLATFYDD